MIDKLANGDITKYEEVYQINWILALNKLAYMKETERMIKELNKQNR